MLKILLRSISSSVVKRYALSNMRTSLLCLTTVQGRLTKALPTPHSGKSAASATLLEAPDNNQNVFINSAPCFSMCFLPVPAHGITNNWIRVNSLQKHLLPPTFLNVALSRSTSKS
jgi:hypothetical protein